MAFSTGRSQHGSLLLMGQRGVSLTLMHSSKMEFLYMLLCTHRSDIYPFAIVYLLEVIEYCPNRRGDYRVNCRGRDHGAFCFLHGILPTPIIENEPQAMLQTLANTADHSLLALGSGGRNAQGPLVSGSVSNNNPHQIRLLCCPIIL